MVSIATERAARAGVLVKDRLALESMRTVNTVLFDKTGTLTMGAPAVTAIEPAGSIQADELLALAAAAETDSEHPLPARSSPPRRPRTSPSRPRMTLNPLPRWVCAPRWTGESCRWAVPLCSSGRMVASSPSQTIGG